MLQMIIDRSSQAFESLFSNRIPAKNRWWVWIWLGMLYLGGIVMWYRFFAQGHIRFDFQDWYLVAGPRLYFLKDALMHGVLPLHVSNRSALGEITDRYMSIPDAFLAPQSILLLFLSVTQFILVNQVFMVTIGFAGLLWFRKKYSLSVFAFSALVLLFNFNGHVLSHYGIGHLTWGGYFLFPWYVMLVISLLEGDHSWMWVAKMSALLFFMWLNGSFHQFVWCLLFLVILGVTTWRTAATAGKAVVFSLILGLVRLLPPALLTNAFNGTYHYMGGFPTATDIIAGLTTIMPANTEINVPFTGYTLGWWEFSLFIGIIGTIFLGWFGVVRWLQKHENGAPYHELVLPVAGMIVLSVGQTFTVLRFIPLFGGERATARVISLPFIFLLILAVIELQRWLNARHLARWAYLGLVVLTGLEVHDLYQFFRTWQIEGVYYAFQTHQFDVHGFYAANHPDPVYFQAIIWGAVGTLAGLLVLGLIVWLEKRGDLETYAQRALARLEHSPAARHDAAPSFGIQLCTALIRTLVPTGTPAAVQADVEELRI